MFLIVFGLAALVRLVTMIAYFPAFWYSDSFGYLPSAFRPYPFAARPVGYSLLLLWPLRVFHSVAAVAIIQHIFGLLAGILIFVLLRLRFQFASWTATLAAAPVLLSAYEIQLEHFMLSDALFMQDFVPSEFQLNPQPDNVLALTKLDDNYTITGIARVQLNNFFQSTERLPEVVMDVKRQEILDTAKQAGNLMANAWQTGRQTIPPDPPDPESIEHLIDRMGVAYLLIDDARYANAESNPLGRAPFRP